MNDEKKDVALNNVPQSGGSTMTERILDEATCIVEEIDKSMEALKKKEAFLTGLNSYEEVSSATFEGDNNFQGIMYAAFAYIHTYISIVNNFLETF